MLVPVQTVSLTAAAGAVDSGEVFDDLTAIAGFPFAFKLDRTSPIAGVEFTGIDRVKGMRVTYRLADGSLKPVVHGATPPKGAPGLELTESEVFVNIVGRAGSFNGVASILQLYFVSLNKATGELKVHGPFLGPLSEDSGNIDFSLS
jgi:hypothetical protein